MSCEIGLKNLLSGIMQTFSDTGGSKFVWLMEDKDGDVMLIHVL